jgi:hypothetical protein
MITPLIFVCMDVVTGSRKCLVNFNKHTLELKIKSSSIFKDALGFAKFYLLLIHFVYHLFNS